MKRKYKKWYNRFIYNPRKDGRFMIVYFCVGIVAVLLDIVLMEFSSCSTEVGYHFSLFQKVNIGEGILWICIGLSFTIWTFIKKCQVIRYSLVIGVVFMVFGISDFVESNSGAWWCPWWLLIWKVLCIAILLGFLVRYYRQKHLQHQ